MYEHVGGGPLFNAYSLVLETHISLSSQKPVAAKNILEFHEASQMIGARYPFSLAFGAANTREASAKSAGEVYDRLLASGGGTRDSLSLDTIHAIAWKGGSSNGQKAEELTQLLRPDRSGNISRSDFLIVSCSLRVYGLP